MVAVLPWRCVCSSLFVAIVVVATATHQAPPTLSREAFDTFLSAENSDGSPETTAVTFVAFVVLWSPRCAELLPAFRAAASEVHRKTQPHGGATQLAAAAVARFAVVDAESDPELAHRFDITAFPAILVFRGGQLDASACAEFARHRHGPAPLVAAALAVLHGADVWARPSPTHAQRAHSSNMPPVLSVATRGLAHHLLHGVPSDLDTALDHTAPDAADAEPLPTRSESSPKDWSEVRDNGLDAGEERSVVVFGNPQSGVAKRAFRGACEAARRFGFVCAQPTTGAVIASFPVLKPDSFVVIRPADASVLDPGGVAVWPAHVPMTPYADVMNFVASHALAPVSWMESDTSSLLATRNASLTALLFTTADNDKTFRYAVRRLQKAAAHFEGRVSFLLAHPGPNMQIFRQYDFNPDIIGKAVCVGAYTAEKKYRFQNDNGDLSGLVPWVTNVLAGEQKPFVLSARVPTSNPLPGEGREVVLTHDTFKSIVFDRGYHVFVFFYNSMDPAAMSPKSNPASTRVKDKLIGKLTRTFYPERRRLVIASFDAADNDDVPFDGPMGRIFTPQQYPYAVFVGRTERWKGNPEPFMDKHYHADAVVKFIRDQMAIVEESP